MFALYVGSSIIFEFIIRHLYLRFFQFIYSKYTVYSIENNDDFCHNESMNSKTGNRFMYRRQLSAWGVNSLFHRQKTMKWAQQK